MKVGNARDFAQACQRLGGELRKRSFNYTSCILKHPNGKIDAAYFDDGDLLVQQHPEPKEPIHVSLDLPELRKISRDGDKFVFEGAKQIFRVGREKISVKGVESEE